ncbi:hypothetical protein RISK_004894 [Rhodopirellula islandica]|uniref:Uncharacterized protein n=1 Tax=Rhodopirellula islandica TaxID=595434 RepID=A0A0J1B9C2_RHOIS|nr:hypothetical protein RISK_004894 [Rhodopirellula islandica]
MSQQDLVPLVAFGTTYDLKQGAADFTLLIRLNTAGGSKVTP